MQDYKSLRVAVMICTSTLVNTQAHTHGETAAFDWLC